MAALSAVPHPPMSNFLLRDPNCVLIHIPKTGGLSIRRGIWKSNYEGPVFGEIPAEWDPYFKFAFVRNPFDRLVSAFLMFKFGTKDEQSFVGPVTSAWSFQDFVDIVLDESIRYDGGRQTVEEHARHHCIQMTHPFNCLDRADYIGRFEKYEEGVAHISQVLNVEIGRPPKLNATGLKQRTLLKKAPYRDYYDANTKRLVEKFYEEDLRRFNYTW